MKNEKVDYTGVYIVKINKLEKEIEDLKEIIKQLDIKNLWYKNTIDKAIEYIETHQLNFKKGITTFGSERLSMEERKLIDILRGVDKE